MHHLPDLGAALTRLAGLTRPGGALVVGLASNANWMDVAIDMFGVAQHRVLTRTRGFWEHTAPMIGTFPHTYAEVRQVASSALTGMRWRRLPLFRCAITWRKRAHRF